LNLNLAQCTIYKQTPGNFIIREEESGLFAIYAFTIKSKIGKTQTPLTRVKNNPKGTACLPFRSHTTNTDSPWPVAVSNNQPFAHKKAGIFALIAIESPD
jgi:hypothetical protein